MGAMRLRGMRQRRRSIITNDEGAQPCGVDVRPSAPEIMRLDRAVALLAFRSIGPLPPRSPSPRLPVLMYHSISDTEETATPYLRTSTHPAVFAEHMRLLDNHGYRG